ncbi:receptor L domain-containing protein [Paraliomyxa miuraensis]|uniref:hypothetical protein n=1 Tax=Paraliomyxa miuraensis TaxID=376150 RepID=UPI0022535AA5|nr:hypothetical protein [Paraliomyxa miuraensis]MCX4245097.1 hypothetical protein [Paraliomyxa miuraensis]
MRGWTRGVLAVVLCTACGDDTGSGEDAPEPSGGTNIECGSATLPGHLVIESEADLSALDGVRAVEGELQVNRTNFTNLDFLGCIEEVGGELTIFGNTALIDVSGLDRLRHAGASLVFSENTAITELSGIGALTQIDGSLVIQGNARLQELSGMASVHTIGGALTIRENDSLLHIDGLRGLRTLGTLFAVTHNPSLCISSVNQVGVGITNPAEPGDNWSTRANDNSC